MENAGSNVGSTWLMGISNPPPPPIWGRVSISCRRFSWKIWGTGRAASGFGTSCKWDKKLLPSLPLSSFTFHPASSLSCLKIYYLQPPICPRLQHVLSICGRIGFVPGGHMKHQVVLYQVVSICWRFDLSERGDSSLFLSLLPPSLHFPISSAPPFSLTLPSLLSSLTLSLPPLSISTLSLSIALS